MHCCCGNPNIVLPDVLSRPSELARNLTCCPRDVSIKTEYGVMLQAELTILPLVGRESFAELAYADDADEKRCCGILSQETMSRPGQVALDLALVINKERCVEDHPWSVPMGLARDGVSLGILQTV